MLEWTIREQLRFMYAYYSFIGRIPLVQHFYCRNYPSVTYWEGPHCWGPAVNIGLALKRANMELILHESVND